VATKYKNSHLLTNFLGGGIIFLMRVILKICLFLICFCNLLFGFNIEGITFKKLNKVDKGTISIYLKNESQIPLKIEELYFNDFKIDKIPSDLILYCQLTPPEIEPEKYGQLKIKLRWETKKLIKILD